jgi:HSP20 family molecular chaperone IbpA
MSSSRPPSTHSSSTGYYFPPPEPPIILPEPGDDFLQTGSLSQNDAHQRRAPHVPFLSHGPPPADSYIEVETTLRDYRLLVRLPGFTRDAITLASKRRRILHIVADRWEGVGGHFERRISFGYDADLVQVRAEFDGEMLRVVVPRKPMSSYFVASNN